MFGSADDSPSPRSTPPVIAAAASPAAATAATAAAAGSCLKSAAAAAVGAVAAPIDALRPQGAAVAHGALYQLREVAEGCSSPLLVHVGSF